MSKEIKKLIRALEKQGFEIISSRHIKVRRGEVRVSFSRTASDKRALRNIKADLKRAGADMTGL